MHSIQDLNFLENQHPWNPQHTYIQEVHINLLQLTKANIFEILNILCIPTKTQLLASQHPWHPESGNYFLTCINWFKRRSLKSLGSLYSRCADLIFLLLNNILEILNIQNILYILISMVCLLVWAKSTSMKSSISL